MKKTIWSLAALMMLIAAPIMTSCSNDLDEITPTKVEPTEETQGNVVTLTIKMSEPAESRVSIDETTLKLTGWEENDVVKVYHVQYANGEGLQNLSEPVEFTCTNAAEGTFTGTLPAGKTLNDYNVAVYGHDIDDSYGTYSGFKGNCVSRNLKDVIFLAGSVKNGSCTMTIHNNVVKVTNNLDIPVDCAWKRGEYVVHSIPYTLLDHFNGFGPRPGWYNTWDFEEAKITIPTGVSYVYLGPIGANSKIGLLKEDKLSTVIPYKEFPRQTVGKLFKASINPTGTAKATIGGNEVDVRWIQLWADGPKFAEYNVGVTDGKEESFGGYYCWGKSIDKDSEGAYNTGTDPLTGSNDTARNLWGNYWRMPTKGELEDLLSRCNVQWTAVNGVPGRRFTGKVAPYNSNSIFLPAAGYYYEGSITLPDCGFYRSSTPLPDTEEDYLNSAYTLRFWSDYQGVRRDARDRQESVRAVMAR